MEGHIITDFQNLQVFSKSDILRMDDLVQDLASALEETARCTRSKTTSQSKDNFAVPSSSRSLHKKRKCKKRRNFKWDTGNISEASESSIDEALKDYMENVMHFSDSDDISVSQRIQRLTMPLSSNFVPSVESDSVTETFSPIRPQRRRKKHKSMLVDLETNASPPPSTSHTRSYRQIQTRQSSMMNSTLLQVDPKTTNLGSSPSQDFYPGKRKRSSKSRSDHNGDGGRPDKDSSMDTGMCSQESTSSSLSSSSDSDGLTTNDEGKEADDEQSDFYYEPGPACGIPGIIPWWENQQEGNPEELESEKQFQQILNGTFEHLPKSSQLAFRARVTRLMAKSGRQMRFGRRRLKQKVPGYTVSRFLQDQQSWTTMQGKLSPAWQSSNGSGATNDIKRRKKTPPPPSQCNEGKNKTSGFVGEDADPIPESNIGNKMLQSMGWNPGSGLGSDGAGIKTPVMAFLRPRRQGLGCSASNKTQEPGT